MNARRALRPWAFAAAALASALILWHFHDRFWYPSDDGIYANQAERIASGQILNLEVQDLHPGYATFVNAGALRLFGFSLLSLRYPLIGAALLQSVFAFLLLARRSLLLATTGAVATVALGVIQFLNPTPHWYCLALAFVLAHWMTAVPRNGPARLIGAGFLTGVITLFRQLSGVWTALAVVAIALLDRTSPPSQEKRSPFARGVLIVALLLLLLFIGVSQETEPSALVLFATWPIAILVIAIRRTRLTDRQTTAALGQLAAGVVIASAPLLIYCLVHRSGAAWWSDNVGAASHLGHVVGNTANGPWFASLVVAAASQIVGSMSLGKIANGVYWATLPLLASINGVMTIRRLRHDERPAELALPILAAFYALIALFMQDAIYLYFTVGLTLSAVLWLVGQRRPATRGAWAGAALLLTSVALAFHAGQPYTRTSQELLEGRRTWTAFEECLLPRCRVRLGAGEFEPYDRLVQLIQRTVPPGAPIAVFPSDAELYFLADRRNPFRFYNSAIGVTSQAAIDDTVRVIQQEAPRIITFRPADKFSTEATRAIMDRVLPAYARLDTIGGVEVYRLKTR